MSTTFDPSKEVTLHALTKSASTNGKPEISLSQRVTHGDFWRPSAPKPLRKEALSAEEALTLYWNERDARTSIADLCDAQGTPLEWGKLANSISATSQTLLDLLSKAHVEDLRVERLRKKAKKEIQSALNKWLEATAAAQPGYDLGMGCLAAAHLLHQFGEVLSLAAAWQALDLLWSTARHVPTWNLGAEATPENVVASQLLGIELPLTLAYCFSEMAPMAKMARAACDYLEGSAVELLNGQGLPRGAHLSSLRSLAACWTRCAAIAGDVDGAKVTKKSRRQYRGLVRQALRWTAPDGTQVLSFESAEAWPADFMRAALRQAGRKKDASAAAELLGNAFIGELKPSKKSPEACYDCEWAGLAVMRRRFSAEEPVVAIDYSTPHMQIDVWAGRRRLLGGALAAESHIDGKLLRPTGPWENLCWFTDKDINFLELSLPLHGEARLDRQIMLALRDGFMIIADHLHHSESAALQHELQIPLGPSLLFCGEGETRDALLVDGEPLARLMPLALPEWRIDPRVGELSFAGGAVRLSQKASAKALACPLFVDLRPERSGRQATWRQLTVAEGLEIQPPDVAVSYRIQSGKDQWVLYRSQGPRGNRSFLGQNTSNEFFIGRFKAPSGEVESLLEIEG